MNHEYLAVLAGFLAAIIGFLLWIVRSTARKIIALVAIAVFLVFAIMFLWPNRKPSPLDAQFSTAPGISTLPDFLSALSGRGVTVMIDPDDERQLASHTLKIRAPKLKDAPIHEVLDKVLLPQLAPFGKWTYTVSGNIIMIKRRPD